MIGPKIELVLERHSTTSDNGGSSSKTWTSKRKIRGVLTTIYGRENVLDGRQAVLVSHIFWCDYQKGLDISEKDEFSKQGLKWRFKVIHVDNVLSIDKMLRIELLQIK